MKRTTRKYILLAFISLSFVLNNACEKEIEFKGQDTESKIVLYSNMETDSLISCQIGLSYAIFNTEYTPPQIKNAEVKLYKDDVFIENLNYSLPPESSTNDYYEPNPFSKYISAINRSEAGAEYKIEVSIPGYKSVISSTLMPEQTNILDFNTEVTEITEYDWTTKALKIIINFKDNPGKEDFYRLVVKQKYGRYPYEKSQPYNDTIPILISEQTLNWLNSTDPLINPSEDEDIFGYSSGNENNIFSDEKISGKEYELTFNLGYNEKELDTSYHEFLNFYISLQSISKDFYYYLKSYTNHKNTDGAIFTEPVLVYSNVINGLGILGASTNNLKIINYGNYPVEGVKYVDEQEYWDNYYVSYLK